MRSSPLHRRLLVGAFTLLAFYLVANVGFYLIRSYAAYRAELERVAQAMVDRVRLAFDDIMDTSIREALVSAARAGEFREALLEYDGSYAHRVALFGGLQSIQSAADSSYSAYALLYPTNEIFSTETGEFSSAREFYDSPAAAGLQAISGLEIWSQRSLQFYLSERIVTSIAVPVRGPATRAAIVVNFDHAALTRSLLAQVPGAAEHLLRIVESSTADSLEERPDASLIARSVRVSSRSLRYDQLFVLDLGSAGIVEMLTASASFAGIGLLAAALLFAGFAFLVSRSLRPLDLLLARVTMPDDNGEQSVGIAALDVYLSSLMSENERLAEEYERLLPERKKELLRDLFNGNITASDRLHEQLEFNNVSVSGPAVIAACLLLEVHDLGERRRLEANTVVQRLLSEHIDAQRDGFHVLVSRDYYGIAISVEPGVSVADLEAPFLALLASAPEVIQQRMYIGLGAPVSRVGNLVDSYEQAQSALGYRLTLGRHVICVASLPSVTTRRYRYPYERERLLIERLQSGDEEGSLTVLNEMLDQIVAERLGDREIEYLRLQLIHALNRYFFEHELEEGEQQNFYQEYDVRHAMSIDDARRVLTDIVRRTIDAQSRRHSASRKALVGKLIDFIREHCIESNLQLLDLEEEFGLNRYYIGQLISEHTGKHFNEHLNESRVARALEIMHAEPGVAIKDVAGRVGYAYPYYFTRQFKRIHGLTPKIYQETRIVIPSRE